MELDAKAGINIHNFSAVFGPVLDGQVTRLKVTLDDYFEGINSLEKTADILLGKYQGDTQLCICDQEIANKTDLSSGGNDMILTNEKQALRVEVEQFLQKNYHITPDTVSSVTNVVLKNWFEELDNGGSHLTSDLIADNIADIAKRYSVH